MKKRAVFLDRDGVLNEAVIKNGKPYPPASLEELKIPNDVPAALRALKAAGFLLLGATNQPDVARGKTLKNTVEAINNHLITTLQLDTISVCYHDDTDNCGCRKPKPGLLLDAAHLYNVNLSSSIMIGDRWKDIEAGQAAGCKTIFIDKHYAEARPQKEADYTTDSLQSASLWILTHF